jgi:DNA-binding response OmpR family regulator
MPEKSEQTRLLFVEDEEGIRLTLGTLLNKSGFEVTTVATI